MYGTNFAKIKKTVFTNQNFQSSTCFMFHVIPILKMPVHANYFHRAIERVRHFYNGLTLYTKQEKCSYKPLLKEISILLCKNSHWKSH